MKHLYKCMTLSAFTLFCVNSNGQTIPNGSFESWNVTNYDAPADFNTSNRETLREGAVTTKKVTGSSGSAVRLETMMIKGSLMGGYITNSYGEPDKDGGVPYSQQPTGMTGKCRYQTMGSDTAIMLIVFKKAGQQVGMVFHKFSGNQSSFTTFNIPLTLAMAPDSVIISAASSNLITQQGVAAGSFLELDELAFTGSGITQPIPGGSFDNWTASTYESPVDWTVYEDRGFSKSTDAYKGAYALELQNFDRGNGQISIPGVTNSPRRSDGSNGNGRPFDMLVDTVFGYYKYSSSGADTASVGIYMTKNGVGTGGGGTDLKPAAAYTYFEIPISGSSAPDSLSIYIYSSRTFPPVNGSKLIIDEVQLKSQLLNTGIVRINKGLSSIAYPNPAKDLLTVRLDQAAANGTFLRITDLLGRQLWSGQLQGSSETIDISFLQPGTYCYVLEAKDGSLGRQKFVKE